MSRPTSSRARLDAVLADRGLFASRAKAAAAVLAGEVFLGDGRERASKPSQMVDPEVAIDVDSSVKRYVSRGGIKLANALDSLSLEVEGRSALDAGASTGGFTDCLLQRGATRVLAVDVGYGELAWSLRNDERVEVRERTNVRALTRSELAWPVDLVVCDLSFISLAKVLPALVALPDGRFDAVAMIKPQFEVGRSLVGKGGVVRDPAVRRQALVDVGECALSLGLDVCGYASSGLPGPKGNLETFIHITNRNEPRPSSEVEAMAAEVEP